MDYEQLLTVKKYLSDVCKLDAKTGSLSIGIWADP